MNEHPMKHQVQQLWRAGFDTAEIARLLKVAEAWVYHVLASQREERVAA